MYTLPILTTLFAALSVACPLHEDAAPADIEKRQSGCTSYGYAQRGRDWATQCPSLWSQCGTVDQQSPINLPANSFARTHVPTISFPGGSRVRGEIFNREGDFGPEWHPVSGAAPPQLRFDNGPIYSLLQWHTHTPTSEHQVGGAYARGEIHFVFGTGSTPHAVLGVRMGNGNASPFWNSVYSELDGQGRPLPGVGSNDRPVINIDFAGILNSNFFGTGRYWTYRGSLTTPACTQGLRWFVAGTNDNLSGAQFSRLEAASTNSVREIQTVRNQQINA